MEDKDYEKDFKAYNKWFIIEIITTIGTAIFSCINPLLNILKEYTDIEVKAPFLYGATFIWILAAVLFVFLTSMIVSNIKTRRYKRLIDKNESDDDGDSDDYCQGDEDFNGRNEGDF